MFDVLHSPVRSSVQSSWSFERYLQSRGIHLHQHQWVGRLLFHIDDEQKHSNFSSVSIWANMLNETTRSWMSIFSSSLDISCPNFSILKPTLNKQTYTIKESIKELLGFETFRFLQLQLFNHDPLEHVAVHLPLGEIASLSKRLLYRDGFSTFHKFSINFTERVF